MKLPPTHTLSDLYQVFAAAAAFLQGRRGKEKGTKSSICSFVPEQMLTEEAPSVSLTVMKKIRYAPPNRKVLPHSQYVLWTIMKSGDCDKDDFRVPFVFSSSVAAAALKEM